MTSEEHAFCQSNNSSSGVDEPDGSQTPLPTRLIDVGPPDSSQEPRLILWSDIRPSGSHKYSALSHCWGGAQFLQIGATPPDYLTYPNQVSAQVRPTSGPTGGKPLTTLVANLEDRMRSIPMAILPKTFRDSVKITRGLGLRYIWIDSLCIIQDSKTDWEQEAAQMADIYKNSYVTIAAESSPDSHFGILHRRTFSFSAIEVPFHSTIYNLQASMFIRPAIDSWETSLTSPKSKLCSRAWVLQESLLAPRTLHFSSQQMLWECRSRSLSEGDMTPIPPSTRERIWSWTRNKRFLAEVEDKTSLSPESEKLMKGLRAKDVLYLQWYEILRDYSARKITFSSDVFPALVGLATEFNRRLDDRYFAGLWEGDIHRGLLWTIGDSERAEVVAPYRAPTWSWASVAGQIGHMDACLHMVGSHKAEILDIQSTPATKSTTSTDQNYYAEISSATLRLRSRYCPANHWPKFEEKYYETHIIPTTDEKYGVMFRYFDCGSETRYLERHMKGQQLGLLHIANWATEVGAEPVVYLLILESGDGGDERFFKRVGVVAMHNTVDFESWIEEWDVREMFII